MTSKPLTVGIALFLAAGSWDVCAQVGSDWVEATADAGFSPRYETGVLDYANKMWVITGRAASLFNDVWYSSDGINWIEATASAGFGGRSEHTCVVYDNKMWVIAGSGGAVGLEDVWYSTNGATWIQATASAAFGKRGAHTCVVYDDGTGEKMWVIGGLKENGSLEVQNDVWYSADGANWIEATASAAFPARGEHSSIVFDDGTGEKMWVIGGLSNFPSNYDSLNDVWYSTDGVSWTLATASAAFSPRYQQVSMVYDSKMWVIAGEDDGAGPPYFGDVWYSIDGTNWIEATASAGFGERNACSGAVFNNKMWMVSGYIAIAPWIKSDIWYSPPDLTPTVSATITLTGTISPTETITPTTSPTLTISLTATATPTRTASPTVSPTVIIPSATATPSVTQTFTVTPSLELEEIVVYPNPFDPNKAVGGTLKFKGLPDGAKVSIYTVSGELVRELTEESSAAYWDAKTKNGKMVSMGSYVYVIRVGKETVKRGKVVVQR